MSKKVAPFSASPAASLYATDGGRKYLNAAERRRAIAAIKELPGRKALFALVLVWSGARVSEVLALTPASFQVESGIVAIRTLKRRRFVVREVPLPPRLMRALDLEFDLTTAQQEPDLVLVRLWPWHRTTAWRLIKKVMTKARLSGRAACPRGLRHAFGVGTLQSGVPLNLVQRWLGHARMTTTAIYAGAIGPEERELARRFWEHGDTAR